MAEMGNARRVAGRLMGGASVLVLAAVAVMPWGVAAQTAMQIEEINVTSSRIQRSGFEAPTPVTMIGAADMELRGTTNVADIINELPSFSGSRTPSSTTLDSRGNGTNALDLRGLGTNRNLVLVNGRRHVPGDEFGSVDLNVIPSLAIQRVEVVTGGASAAWGSDAISGVVNIIYDKTLEGLKFEAQFGIAGEGDAENYRLSMAYGTRTGDDRGHILIAADWNDSKGIPFATARDWSNRHPGFLQNPADTGPNDGIPAFRIATNAKLFLGSPNGVTLPGGPLGNLEFLPGGQVVPRALGSLGGVLMEGGSGSTLTDFAALVIPNERKNVMAAFDYALTEDINFYFEGGAAKSDSEGAMVSSFSFGVPVLSGNPYIPGSVQAIMDAEGIASFDLYRTNDEFGAITSISSTDNYRFVLGFDGNFANDWTWDIYYQYGRSDFSNHQINNLIPGNLALAMDAVRDPVTNEIVCRSAAPGCVPINMFGAGSPSAAAIDYVTGTSMSETRLKQQVVAASVSGDLLENWAGTIATTFGAEYRKESLDREVDDLSAQSAFLITNAQPLSGSYNVKEVFGEVLIPLLSEGTLGQGMDFNGAVRYTDYSTSGSVVTWKAGLTYEPSNDLRFRGTVSRDIRAPAIGEVFLKTLLLFGNVDNPFTNGHDFVQVRNTGNADLQEERALTKTVGFVYSPSWVDNLQLSVDWYDIDIDDAISQISSQSIVDRCGAGEAEFCDLVTFGPGNVIQSVENKLLNLGTFRLKGLDFEGRYVTSLGNGHMLGFNLLGSYVYSKKIATDGTNPTDYAGEVGPVSGFGLPKWKGRASVTYGAGPLGLHTQLRYVGSGKYDITAGPEQLSAADNKVGAEVYLDLSARYQIEIGNERIVELFGGINNALDNDPPLLPIDFIGPTATNAVFYDVIGRYFYGGVRAKF